MKRRTLLGFLGAAAVAGPKLATDLVSQARAAQAGRLTDKVTASSIEIAPGTSRILTECYDARVHPTLGAAFYRESSLAETTGVDDRLWFQTANGRYFVIDENQRITLTMAGGRGDLAYEHQTDLIPGGGNGNGVQGTSGFIRLGGTSDRDAMLALDAFCFAKGIPAYIDADHYISGEVELKTLWRGIGIFNNTIWTEYFYAGGLMDKLECGLVFLTSNSGLLDVKVIGQWNTRSGKPNIVRPDMPILGLGGGLGHLGTIIRVGEFDSLKAQPLRVNINLRVMLMRAGRNTRTGHHSQANIMIAVMGHVEDSTYEIGLFGQTNTANNIVILCHFGFKYLQEFNPEGFDDANNPHKTQATMLETYHPSRLNIHFLTDMDNEATFARMLRPYELAACSRVTVWPYRANGICCGAGVFGVGDYGELLTTERQKGTVGKGHRIGYIKATNCWQLNFSTETNNGGFYIKGNGTVSGSGFLYEGTEQNPESIATGNAGITIRQQTELEADCVGFDLEIFNSAHDPLPSLDGLLGIYLQDAGGRINLGDVIIRGDARRGIEIEHGHGELQINSYRGVGALSYEFSRGGRFRSINNSRGPDQAPDGTGLYKPGYEAQNVCAQVIGTTFPAGTLASDAAPGETKLLLTEYLPKPVYVGDKIQVGNVWTVATELIRGTHETYGGVKYLKVAPLAAAAAAGATITVDQRGEVREFTGGFESSQYGLLVSNAHVYNCNLGDVKWTGQNAARLTNDAFLELVGSLPATVGRMTGSNYTVDASKNSRVLARGLKIPGNALVARHFRLLDTSALSMNMCEVEDFATLLTASDRKKQVQMLGVVDYNGAQLR